MTGLLCTEPRAVLILGTGYLGKALAESGVYDFGKY